MSKPLSLLNLAAVQDPVVRAALQEIQRSSYDTLQNDQSSSGTAIATVTGAAADEIVYFTGQTTTAFTALTAFGRSLIASASSAVATALLAVFGASGASHSTGLVPDPGAVAGTTHFLREDATWQVPAGTGVTSVATTYPISGGTITTTGTLTFVGPTTSGRLQIVSATQIKFAPFNGDTVRINGVIFQIPSGGVTANNTSIFIDGASGQNLAANTLYFVYLFNNSGTLTIDYSTTGHTTSANTNNVGTEVKNVGGGDSRSLVGMVFTDGSAQFNNAGAKRNVASWFNRRPLGASGSFTANRAITNQPSFVEVNSEIRIEAMVWGDESFSALGAINSFNNALSDTSWSAFGLSTDNGGTFNAVDGAMIINGSTAFEGGVIGDLAYGVSGDTHIMLTILGTINTANSLTYAGGTTPKRTTISLQVEI